MIRITREIAIDEKELRETFVRASGPGGQNVNKVATAVQLRFDVRHSPSLPEQVRRRLVHLAGRRIHRDGALLLQAQRYRTQEQNRADARARLVALIRLAATSPTTRRRTKPTLASKRKRLENKRRRSTLKDMRRRVGDDE